jgi:hypothetical protein
MLKLLSAAMLALAPIVPADFTMCIPIPNGPITPHKPEVPFVRKPDEAAYYPKTLIFDGMPPERMRGPAVVTVSTGTVAECGTPPSGGIFEACVRGDNIIHTDNPCDHPDQSYARLLCHEIAHAAHGWPAEHGA